MLIFLGCRAYRARQRLGKGRWRGWRGWGSGPPSLSVSRMPHLSLEVGGVRIIRLCSPTPHHLYWQRWGGELNSKNKKQTGIKRPLISWGVFQVKDKGGRSLCLWFPAGAQRNQAKSSVRSAPSSVSSPSHTKAGGGAASLP